MNVQSLADLNLHDSELLEVIVRKDQNDNDQIILHLNYLDDYESVRTSRKVLVFSNCIKAILDLNFGLEGHDSLRGGYEVEDSILVGEIRSKYERHGILLSDTLKHFRIETNSTASILDIVAECLELCDG